MERTYKRKRNPLLKGLKFLGFIILGALAAAGFAFVFGYFVMLLWNWLMPTIFGITTITFWQAAGIVLLARLIFGGFKHGHDHHKSSKHPRKFIGEWKQASRKEYKCGDWRHFDEYWEEEGEKSYTEYVERKKEQEQK